MIDPQIIGTIGFAVLGLVIIYSWFYGGPYVREIARNRPGRYLTRVSLRVQAPKRGAWRAYWHKFHGPDDEGHHNHPWKWSFSIVLLGSYTEERLKGVCGVFHTQDACDEHCRSPRDRISTVARRVRFFNVLRADDYHRITELHPTFGCVWTLFFTGPFSGLSWGFWIPGRGHVHWKLRQHERGRLVGTVRI